MTAKANEVQFTVNLSNDLLARMTSMAEHGGISRHKLIRNILVCGIEQVDRLDDVGIFQLGILIRNMVESPEKAHIRKTSTGNSSDMPIPIRIEKIFIERLEQLADKSDMNRQRLAQNILKAGIEELEAGKKYKLTNFVIMIRDMQNLFTDVIEMGKRAFYAGKEVNTK